LGSTSPSEAKRFELSGGGQELTEKLGGPRWRGHLAVRGPPVLEVLRGQNVPVLGVLQARPGKKTRQTNADQNQVQFAFMV